MKFRFSISDLGAFLGKSPVTIRAWERKGLIKLPRVGTNRAMTVAEVREAAGIAYDLGRIDGERRWLIHDALTSLSLLEDE